MWLIGDAFLAGCFPALQELQTRRNTEVYLQQSYNLCTYFENPTSMERNAITRILNSLAAALNERIRLPKFVIMFPDIDILSTIHYYEFAMPLTFHICLEWLFKQVDHFFAGRRDNLRRIRPGSVGAETRFIWVMAVNRPAIKNHPDRNYNKVVTNRGSFNEVLNDLVAETRCMHAVEIEFKEPQFFDTFGNLSAMGKEYLWRELDYIFKRFDKHEINLKPIIPAFRKEAKKIMKKNRKKNKRY